MFPKKQTNKTNSAYILHAKYFAVMYEITNSLYGNADVHHCADVINQNKCGLICRNVGLYHLVDFL